MTEAKLFSYDPQLTADADWIRFYVGDTVADRAELDDREIAALLADEPEPEPPSGQVEPTTEQWQSYRALVAARAAEMIAALHARDADVSFENQRVGLSSKFAQYTALAKRFRELAQNLSGASSRMLRVERW